MRQADLQTGVGKLRDAAKRLQAGWLAVSHDWRDSAHDRFEEEVIAPIESQTLGTVEALTKLAEILARAEHECS